MSASFGDGPHKQKKKDDKMKKPHNIGYVKYIKKNSFPLDYFGVKLHEGDLVGCACCSAHLPYSPSYEWFVVGFCSNNRFVLVASVGTRWFAKVPSRVLVKIEKEV